MNRNILKRILLLLPALALEVIILLLLSTVLEPFALPISLALRVLGFLYTLFVITKEDEDVYKIIWLLVIMLLPVVGALGYLLFGNKRTGKPLRRAIESSKGQLPEMPSQADTLCSTYRASDLRTVQTIASLERVSGYAVHENASAKYYPLGDDMHKDMLNELEKAEKYIFIEYFIIENGILWDSITDILARKVKQGVDVRVMYDDMGSIATYSKANQAELIKKGVQCTAFNPIIFLRGTLNYRSHRKMMIIDGRVAFSGGINMADEYINQRKHPYGHWKDIGYRITGNAVNNFTHMFAEFWNGFSENKIDPSLMLYSDQKTADPDGLALSYYDSPLAKTSISNNLFMDLLSQATDYVWFYTPYLLLGDRLLNAMTDAARRGVDVRIIMPGIPDKKMVFRMAQAYYPSLLEAGVKIYQYTPGFVHAKGCIMDDKVCTIGTVNLDYRSLFLHFENSTLFYKASILDSFKKDYLSTQEKCCEIYSDDMKFNFIKWIIDGLIRIIAPLF